MATTLPGNPAENYTSSGQAGGGTGALFGSDLGGPGQQQGSDVGPMPDGPRNSGGHYTNNPSGDGAAPPLDSVFSTDLGGSGVARETGGPVIPNTISSMGPPGQGGR